MRIIELESATGQIVEFECEMTYTPPHRGGSYYGHHEELGDQWSVDRIYRNGVDVTNRLERLAKKAYALICEQAEAS